jgi:hypothetical protein
VAFIVTEFPNADPFMLHFHATVAEQELLWSRTTLWIQKTTFLVLTNQPCLQGDFTNFVEGQHLDLVAVLFRWI